MSAPWIGPQGTVHSQPFWDGIARGQLTLQRCDACQATVFYPRLACPHCHSRTLTWTNRERRGEIVTYTTVHRARPAFTAWVPYHVGIGDFEGARLFGVIDGTPEIGATIEVISTADASPALTGVPTPYLFAVVPQAKSR